MSKISHEAKLQKSEHGDRPIGDGWFVLNLKSAAWKENEVFGKWISFENDVRFPAVGLNIHLLEPGQAACMYHREDAQEDFLVLSGECKLLVNEEERVLKQWDMVHCPAGTNHVFVGAGDKTCAVLMIGERKPETEIVYPVSELARKHEAGVAKETKDPREAYAGVAPSTPIRSPWPLR